MAYRHIEPRIILPTTVISNNTPVVSQYHDMRTMTRGAIQYIYGAGLSAGLYVYASVDGKTFFDLQLDIPPINGTAGTWGVDLTAYGYPYYEAVVIQTAGSGTMTIWANAKGS
jgi:hypothetical protein